MGSHLLQHKINIEWSPNFAYAIGLITSDGYLNRDGRHISFTSKDLELIEKFKISLNLANKIGIGTRGTEPKRKYFTLTFGDKCFYKFLNGLEIFARKSKTIKMVLIPDTFFADFLRGLFDGDGTFYTFRDTRWPKSFGYQMAYYSASYDFLIWLKEKLSELYGVKGFIHRGKGVYGIRYVKGDSKTLFEKMYRENSGLCLGRKYSKIADAFKFDSILHCVPSKEAGLAHR